MNGKLIFIASFLMLSPFIDILSLGSNILLKLDIISGLVELFNSFLLKLNFILDNIFSIFKLLSLLLSIFN